MSLTVTFDGEVGSIVDRIAAGMSGGAVAAVLRGAEVAAGELRRTSQQLTKTGRATGRLARSWKPGPVVVSGDTIESGAYSEIAYADIHNRGGVVRPKRGKMLAIPVKGTPRGKWPRDYPKGALFRVGNLLVQDTGLTKRGKYKKGTLYGLKILFVLKSSVRIPPTHYIDFAQALAEPDILAAIAGTAQKAIDEA